MEEGEVADHGIVKMVTVLPQMGQSSPASLSNRPGDRRAVAGEWACRRSQVPLQVRGLGHDINTRGATGSKPQGGSQTSLVGGCTGVRMPLWAQSLEQCQCQESQSKVVTGPRLGLQSC